MTRTVSVPKKQLAFPGFQLSPTGLKANKSVTEAQWERAGEALSRISGSINWWIGDWLNVGEAKWGHKYDEACERFGVAYDTAKQVAWVASKVCDRSHKLSWKHHLLVAPLPAEKQSQWLTKAEKEKWTTRDLSKQLRKAKLKESAESNPLPKGKFRVIYADPPREYNDERSGLAGYTAASDHYPTMTVEEICGHADEKGRRFFDLPAEDSVLFLWATSPLLPDAFELIQQWGFDYKTSFVWDKVDHNFGHYNSVRHELLLVCVRGSCTPDSSQLPDSVVEIPRSRVHSRKPEEFYGLIEDLYTRGPYVELFARDKRKGWSSWGDEV
jgi:N6-adenosine-specific RNA methylase IME4